MYNSDQRPYVLLQWSTLVIDKFMCNYIDMLLPLYSCDQRFYVLHFWQKKIEVIC